MELFALATSITADRTLTFTATVVIAGLGIVLVTLAVLIVVFGNIVSKSQNKSKKKAVEAQQKEMQQVSTAPAVKAALVAKPAQQGISGEVVAAISAAVYALEGEGAVIRSITPKKQSPIGVRNPWAQAAVIENTRPF